MQPPSESSVELDVSGSLTCQAEQWSIHSKVHRVRNGIAACGELQAVSPRSQAAGAQIEDVSSGHAERGVETEVVIRVRVAWGIGRSRNARNRGDRRGLDDDRRRRNVVAI